MSASAFLVSRHEGRPALFGFALVFCAIAAVLFALSWNDVCAGFLSDDAVYLMTADGFNPFRHVDARLHSYIVRQTIFPPGYPLLLGVLGGGSDQLLWSHIITTSTLVIALIAMWRWLSREMNSRGFAIGAIAVYALMPGTLLHNTMLMSEFPYLMLTMVAFWFAAVSPDDRRKIFFAAAFMGLAAITRSAGYSLILAALVWMFGKRLDYKIRILGVLLAPFACWYLYQHAGGAHPQGGYDQLWSSLFARADHDGWLSFWPRYFFGQLTALWTGLLINIALAPSIAAAVFGVVLLATALPVWIVRLRRWELDAWYLGFAGAVTLLYPFPDHFVRLIVPLLPIVVAYSFLCAGMIASRLKNRRFQPVPVLALTALFEVCLSPALAFMVQRYFEPVDPALSSWKRTSYWFRPSDIGSVRAEVADRQLIIDMSRDLRTQVPEGECLLATRTALVMLFSHRIVEQTPQPSRFNSDYMEFLLGECPNLFLLGAPGTIAQEPVPAYYPGSEISADEMRLVHTWDNPANPETPIGLLLRRAPKD